MENKIVTENIAKIIEAASEVYERLGTQFELSIYQQAMAVELKLRNLKFTFKGEMHIVYKGFSVGARRTIFWLDHNLIMEVHKTENLENIHATMAFNYMNAFERQAAVVVNFGGKTVQSKQVFKK